MHVNQSFDLIFRLQSICFLYFFIVVPVKGDSYSSNCLVIPIVFELIKESILQVIQKYSYDFHSHAQIACYFNQKNFMILYL